MTALAAQFEAFDNPENRALAFLLGLSTALLLTLDLTGNLLLRYP